jgi:hypothetical protein
LATRFRNRERGGIAPSPSAHTHGLFDRAENAVASIVADFDADDISILQEWREPRHSTFENRSVWSLFNAFTESLKEGNLTELPKRSQALHGLMDTYVGLN